MENKNYKFIIGIDLGTTNCAVSYAKISTNLDEDIQILDFLIPQVTAPGIIEEKPLLPSYMYIASEVELPKGSLDLPWAKDLNYCVGEFARKRGAESPKRLISSAKSWLCHGGISRETKILPLNLDEDIEKYSPIEVSAKYLEHIKNAWNYKMASNDPTLKMEEQLVLITIPASFDAAARDFTVKAAHIAGLQNITLLEEPQAAFYSWINNNKDTWRKQIKENDVILVFDIGGGTTDFSLIYVGQEDGNLTLNRIAVGNHILLGGDNIDIALANVVKQKLEASGKKIDNWQFQSLWYITRNAKETIFNENHENIPVTILSKGKSVISGTIKSELTKSELHKIIFEEFFSKVSINEMPTVQKRIGLTELSLPYANDPKITRHLAKFLKEHVNNEKYQKKNINSTFVIPDAILFNGGVMKPVSLQDHVIDVINSWINETGSNSKVKKLENQDMDLAVARGATYYGLTKLGRGIRIKGGTAASYYIGIESSMPAVPGMPPILKALCVVPAKTEEGTKISITNKEFGLRVGEKSEFKMFVSTTHKTEPPGTILEEWEEGDLIEMMPLETTLEKKDTNLDIVPVTLESYVSEIGTIEIWCVEKNGSNKWKLEFNIRDNEK